MINFLPWLRIVVAISIYIIFALTALLITHKMQVDLKEMKNRTSGLILVIGAVANLGVFGATMLLLKFWDGRPLSDLGLAFTNDDIFYSTTGFVLIFLVAVLLIQFWAGKNKTKITGQNPAKSKSEALHIAGAIGTLFIVALQEEVLYRGYVSLNLIQYGPAVIIIVTAVLFTVIHLITNKGDFYQVLSWFLGGILFACIYLVTGSIWVPVLLHLATDLNNMLMFNIAGKYSFFSLSPGITKRQMVSYKIVTTLLLVVILFGFFGPSFRLL